MLEARRFVQIDGLKTCYYEAGTGPTVVLLHSGEHGACAELTWEFNFHVLATDFHVIAPDWLGYGKTEKIHDFISGNQRRLIHMQRFLNIMCVDGAHFVGASLGGALLLRALTTDPHFFPAYSLTLIGSGGNSPDNVHKRALIEYDCTMQSMRKVVEALFHDKKWAEDENYVRRRFQLSLEPGAWECAAAARLKNPLVPAKADMAQADSTAYENLRLPVLVIAGGADKIKEPGYAEQIVTRMPAGESHTLLNCGHMPNIEQPDAVNEIVKQFIWKVVGSRPTLQ